MHASLYHPDAACECRTTAEDDCASHSGRSAVKQQLLARSLVRLGGNRGNMLANPARVDKVDAGRAWHEADIEHDNRSTESARDQVSALQISESQGEVRGFRSVVRSGGSVETRRYVDRHDSRATRARDVDQR